MSEKNRIVASPEGTESKRRGSKRSHSASSAAIDSKKAIKPTVGKNLDQTLPNHAPHRLHGQANGEQEVPEGQRDIGDIINVPFSIEEKGQIGKFDEQS